MARIAGVDLPNKHVNIALTYIYGIGRSSAAEICEKTKIAMRVNIPIRLRTAMIILVFLSKPSAGGGVAI